jgi:hypothetical protein
MPWYDFVAYFFAGAFLANAVPHFVSGVCGRPFPSPFAKPPGRGLSSPLVNVLWGSFNLAVGYVLVSRVGEFHLRSVVDIAVTALGAFIMALTLAQTFGERLGGK